MQWVCWEEACKETFHVEGGHYRVGGLRFPRPARTENGLRVGVWWSGIVHVTCGIESDVRLSSIVLESLRRGDILLSC